MNILQAHDIHKTYNSTIKPLQVLKGVSLSVEKGKILAIVGPSGAGKSTLLHILGGLDEPSRGKVVFRDQDVYNLSDSQRARIRNVNMGFVFQFYHLLPEFTALENVSMPAAINKINNHDLHLRAKKILERLGLGLRLKHYPSQLSGGEMQRVAIARAMINEPDILFCDEPTGNLDSAAGLQIKELIWEIAREKGQTVVVVTHDEHLVKDADRVSYIKDGIIK